MRKGFESGPAPPGGMAVQSGRPLRPGGGPGSDGQGRIDPALRPSGGMQVGLRTLRIAVAHADQRAKDLKDPQCLQVGGRGRQGNSVGKLRPFLALGFKMGLDQS